MDQNNKININNSSSNNNNVISNSKPAHSASSSGMKNGTSYDDKSSNDCLTLNTSNSTDHCDMTSLEILNKCHLDLFPKKQTICDDVNCMSIVDQLPILNGEYIQFIGPSGKANEDILLVTNFRIFLLMQNGTSFMNVPIMLVESIEIKENILIYIYLKNAKTLRIMFNSNEKATTWCQRFNSIIYRSYKLEELFAFTFYSWLTNEKLDDSNENNKCLFSKNDQSNIIYNEFKRMKFDPKYWRISDVNKKFELCSTYPEKIIVPECVADEKLKKIACFRSSKRFPAVVWRSKTNGAVICRSSQPNVGLLAWRLNEDEQLIKAISDSCLASTMKNQHSNSSKNVLNNKSSIASVSSANGSLNGISNGASVSDSTQSKLSIPSVTTSSATPTISISSNSSGDLVGAGLLIIDARFRSVALANRVKGGGYEYSEYYTNCEIQFMNLENIHVIRSSFQALRLLCLSVNDNKTLLSQLENTKWLHHLSYIIKAACTVINTIDQQAKPVLIHCSDGWDRTPQILALSKLLLDPYYRTIDGFRTLIEVDWLMFGHKFSQRNGHAANHTDINERCPVFLQWLDCVYQITKQFPSAFQFNETFLLKLCLHSYSCLFGTFLCDSAIERVNEHTDERTFSIWSYLNDKNKEIINYLYDDTYDEVLYPNYELIHMQLWYKLFCESDITYLVKVDKQQEIQNFNDSIDGICSCSPPQQQVLLNEDFDLKSDNMSTSSSSSSKVINNLIKNAIDSSSLVLTSSIYQHMKVHKEQQIEQQKLDAINKANNSNSEVNTIQKTRSFDDLNKSLSGANALEELNAPHTFQLTNVLNESKSKCRSEANLLELDKRAQSTYMNGLTNTNCGNVNYFIKNQNRKFNLTRENSSTYDDANANINSNIKTNTNTICTNSNNNLDFNGVDTGGGTDDDAMMFKSISKLSLENKDRIVNGNEVFNVSSDSIQLNTLNDSNECLIKQELNKLKNNDNYFKQKQLSNKHVNGNGGISVNTLSAESSESSTSSTLPSPTSSKEINSKETNNSSMVRTLTDNEFNNGSSSKNIIMADGNNQKITDKILTSVSTSTSGLSEYIESAKFRYINDTIKNFEKNFNTSNSINNSNNKISSGSIGDDYLLNKSNLININKLQADIFNNDLFDLKCNSNGDTNSKQKIYDINKHKTSNSIPIMNKAQDKKRNVKTIQDCIDIDGLTRTEERTYRKIIERDEMSKKEIAMLREQINKCKWVFNKLINNNCMLQEYPNDFPPSDSSVFLNENSQSDDNHSNNYSISNDSVCSSWDEIEESDYKLATWVPDYYVTHCQYCNEKFSLRLRKHHCRNCGQVFCYKCADQFYPLPNHNLTAPVRVCYPCKLSIDNNKMNGTKSHVNNSNNKNQQQQQQQFIAFSKQQSSHQQQQQANIFNSPSLIFSSTPPNFSNAEQFLSNLCENDKNSYISSGNSVNTNPPNKLLNSILYQKPSSVNSSQYSTSPSSMNSSRPSQTKAPNAVSPRTASALNTTPSSNSSNCNISIGSRCNQLDSNKFKKDGNKSQKVSV